MNGLFTILIFIEAGLLSILEHRFYYRWFTPFTVLAWPFLFILVMVQIIGPKLGFVQLYHPVIIYWMIGLLIFWITGIAIRALFMFKGFYFPDPHKSLISESKSPGMIKGVKKAAWLSLLIVYSSLYVGLKKYGNGHFGDPGFTEFFGEGLSGHLIALNMILFVYFIGSVKGRDWSTILLIILIFLSLLFYQVKTWILIPLIAGFYNRFILGNLKLNLRVLLLIVFLGILIFFASYYFTVGLNFKFLSGHLMNYLFSGTLGFSEHLKQNLGSDPNSSFLFRPLVNIYNFIARNPMEDVIQRNFLNIMSELPERGSNVRTLFGTILINSNLLVAILYVILVSSSIYTLFTLSFLSREIWIVTCYSFFVAGLFMGWFDFYFNNLKYYEIPIYSIILFYISRIQFPKLILRKD